MCIRSLQIISNFMDKIRDEDNILEGISGLLLSWNKREKRT